MHITTNPNYADPTDVTEEMEMAIAECLSKPDAPEAPEAVIDAEPIATSRIDSSTYCKKDKDRVRERERDKDKERRGEKRHHHRRSHKSSQEGNDCWKL